MTLDGNILESMVLGGAFYGGGGGGPIQQGSELGRLSLQYGNPTMVSIDEVPEDGVLLTVSAVGAPAASEQSAKPRDYVRAVELLLEHTSLKISGFIPNECGGLASANGWIQSAAFGLPIIDCPCDGRAHPTGMMGSMGLKWPEYISAQATCGGSRAKGSYIEAFVQGPPDRTSALVRHAAVQAGGLVAVARNPVRASYAKSHGAPGALGKCLAVGRAMVDAAPQGALAVAHAAAEASQGRFLFTSRVKTKELKTVGGFDVGQVLLENGACLVFWNEYITLEMGTKRFATFPDLISTMSAESGAPLSSADIVVGMEVAVVVVPKDHLILGAGVKDKSLYGVVEEATNRKVIQYAFS